MALITLAAVVGAIGYVYLTTPTYTAISKILVKIGREQTSGLDLSKQSASSVMINARVQDVFDEVEIMRDPVILNEVFGVLKERFEQPVPKPRPQSFMQWAKYYFKAAKTWVGDALKDTLELIKYPLYELGFSRRLTPDEALHLRFQSALQIKDIKETDVIIMAFAWPDPEFAAFAVNTYVDEYRRQHVKVHGGTSGSVKFYEDQKARVAKDLAAIEQELDDFLAHAGINDLEAEKQATLNLILELETQQNQSAIEQQEARQRIRAYVNDPASSEWPTTPALPGAEGAGLAALDRQFIELVAHRNDVLERYEAGSRQVRDIDRQISALRGQKRQSLKAYFEDRIRTLLEGDAQRTAKIKEKRAYLEKLRGLSLQYDTLKNNRNTIQSELSNYRRKLEELRTTEALNAQDFASVQVISRAVAADALVAPRKGLIVGLAALFGVIFAIAYALLAEFFNQTFRSEREVESVLKIPLLAKIPEIKHDA